MKGRKNNFNIFACFLVVGFLAPAGGVWADSGVSIIPEPVEMAVGDGAFVICSETRIVCDEAALEKARQLAEMLAPAVGYDLKVDVGGERSNAIVMRLDEKLQSLGDEGYRLTVEKSNIRIAAPHQSGLFYGIQTLRQLMPESIYSEDAVDDVTWAVPCVDIEDMPRFAWRGALLDTGRHFMPKAFILKLIDVLAMHKMNSLHLHLTDDQGWRIEIKKYPKLTEVGAWRAETLVGHYYHSPHKYDGKRHGGFYTQDDIHEIVAYAKQRHINIVPEIEMPGHAQAAIAAYPELGNTGRKLDVKTIWGVNPNILNANESTILFFQDVLGEVLEMFPSEFIHIGGDEAPKAQWKASDDAQKRIKELGLKDEHELQSYFIKRMDAFLASKGRRLIGWDEILEGGLAPGATVMSWRGERGGIVAAKAGHDVVMAPTTYTYFDYYQSREKGEPLAIGGYLPLKTVYNYDPVPAALSEQEASRVLGTQGQLWTEYIATPQKAEYMGFPRLTALAEVAWTPNNRKDYGNFIERLKMHLRRLDVLGVNYRRLSPEPVSVGVWKSGQTGEAWAIKEYDLTKHITGAGTYTVTFQYTHGAHRLDIASVELLADGQRVAGDEHTGTTGGATRDNAYTLKVANYREGAKYIMRAKVRSDGGADSNGEINLLKK